MPTREAIKIGAATLDPVRGTLSVAGELVPVRSKAFNLLCYMVRNAGRVMTKDEIFDAVWPGVIVTEDSLTQCVRDARKAIRDEMQEILRTVPRRGYILVEEASVISANGRGNDNDTKIPSEDRLAEPVVAVLPFAVEAGEGGGLVALQSFNEELGDAISRFRSVAVIAAASARKFAPGEDIVHSGIALKADYCVGGSISGGKDLAVRVDLIEVSSGRRIWSDIVTSSSSRLLETPALLATRIVGRLVGTVEADAARRAHRTPTASLQSYSHMIKGIMLLRQHGEGFNEAGKAELEAAERIDEESGLIQAYLALADAMIARRRMGGPGSMQIARERAVRATVLSPEEARCHRVLAVVLTYMQEFAAAEAQYNRAIQLNPYDADTLAQLGLMRAIRGHPEEGLSLMDRAVQLNPFHPDWYHCDRFYPLFMLSRFAEAAESMKRLPHLDARQTAYVAASYALDGQSHKATKHLSQAFEKKPDLDIKILEAATEWELAEHREMLAEGLRRASEMWISGRALG